MKDEVGTARTYLCAVRNDLIERKNEVCWVVIKD